MNSLSSFCSLLRKLHVHTTADGWIKKHQTNFNNQARQPKSEYLSGESHYLFGKRYLLNVFQTNKKHFPARGKASLSGVIIKTDEKTGLSLSIKPLIIGGSLKN